MEKLIITVLPHEIKHKELLRACQMISDQTGKEVGCMDSRVLKGDSDGKDVILEQHWRERHLLDDYFRTDHFTALLGAMKLLGKNYEVTINEGTQEEGMTAVVNARAT